LKNADMVYMGTGLDLVGGRGVGLKKEKVR
jgi:hypothetical protein